jgi:hypothetical protein
MRFATPSIYGWSLGFASRRVNQTQAAEIKELQTELKELSRWLDSGACTADDEDSLKNAIVYIKNQISELSCV